VIVAVVAVLLQVLFCITLARLVTTSLAGMLRSRRGRDFTVFLIIPIFALVELLGQVVPRAAASGGLTAASFAGVDRWLRWLPPGLAAHAIQDASDGRPGSAFARLALLAAIIVVLGWLWVRSLGRALVTADTSTRASQVRAAALPLAGYGVRGAVVARFWIYQRRDPTSLVFWAGTAIIMAVVSASSILGPHKHPAVVIASAVFGAAMVGYFHANSVGFTGPPFVIEAQALTGRRSLRVYFAGQNIALGVIAVPLLAAMCWGLAAAVRRPSEGIAATAVALAGLGAALGLGSVFSVAVPYPMAKRAGSPMRQPVAGYGAYPFAGFLGNLAGAAAAATPVIIAAAATSSAPIAVRAPVLLVCSAAYGLALAWAGVLWAAREAEGRLPELCQIAIRSIV
jgi:ABC-2 type transport system permease protein